MFETNIKDNMNINNITRWAAALQKKFTLSIFILFFRKCSTEVSHLVNISAQGKCYT